MKTTTFSQGNILKDSDIFINKYKTTIQLHIPTGLIHQETSIQKLKHAEGIQPDHHTKSYSN
jgi:hypothetical protein